MSVKCPYFPNVFYQKTTTRFGAIETNVNPYRQKINCRTSDVSTYVIDAYQELEDIFGNMLITDRDTIYTLLSGNAEISAYKKVFNKVYQECDIFANYVNAEHLFGNNTEPLINRLILPLRSTVEAFIKKVSDFAKCNSGKVVIIDRDYIYITFTLKTEIPFKIKESYV